MITPLKNHKEDLNIETNNKQQKIIIQFKKK